MRIMGKVNPMANKKPSGLKTYVITVSRFFPTKHSKEGQETHFTYKILEGLKTHTIRSNYDLWSKRLDEVNAGKAVLSVRVWKNRPYWPSEDGGPAQLEIKRLTSVQYQAVGIANAEILVGGLPQNSNMVAQRDGLTLRDFWEWFGFLKYEKRASIKEGETLFTMRSEKTFEGIIIHFTGDKYTN